MIMIQRFLALIALLLAVSSAAFATSSVPHVAAVVAPPLVPKGGASTHDAELKSPPNLYEGAVTVGTAKALAPASKIFTMGVVSGCHIAFGMYLATTVGGACPGIAAQNPGLQKIIQGAFGLPFGLIMTLVTGGELFTGNTALVTAAKMEQRIKWRDLVKSWTSSYLGNFLGSLLLAFLAFRSGTLDSSPAAVNIAINKCSMPFDVAFIRGLLCNWLVCMGVYMVCPSTENA